MYFLKELFSLCMPANIQHKYITNITSIVPCSYVTNNFNIFLTQESSRDDLASVKRYLINDPFHGIY